MPAFMALAATNTSGTNIMLSLNLTPTIAIPAISPSSSIVFAEKPFSNAISVRSLTTSFLPCIRLTDISCINGSAFVQRALIWACSLRSETYCNSFSRDSFTTGIFLS